MLVRVSLADLRFVEILPVNRGQHLGGRPVNILKHRVFRFLSLDCQLQHLNLFPQTQGLIQHAVQLS